MPDTSPLPLAPLTHAELNERANRALMDLGSWAVAHIEQGGEIRDNEFVAEPYREYRAYQDASLARCVRSEATS